VINAAITQLSGDEATRSAFAEVGAGAGSIARWMRTRHGRAVDAFDIDTTLLQEHAAELNVICADIVNEPLPPRYGLVHSRFLLDVVSDPERALNNLCEGVVSGGCVVVEEFDDMSAAVAIGDEEAVALHERVVSAKQRMWARERLPNHLGRSVPQELARRGLDLLDCGFRGAVRQGASRAAEAWKLSVQQLRYGLTHPGGVDDDELDLYLERLDADPTFFFLSPTVVSTVAKRPAPS
jgi:SAM-dependent methyltransferase